VTSQLLYELRNTLAQFIIGPKIPQELKDSVGIWLDAVFAKKPDVTAFLRMQAGRERGRR